MTESDAIERALGEIARRLTDSGASWVVGGSAGLMLRGIALPRPPRDLDIYADVGDCGLIHERLAAYATDKPVRSVTAIYESLLSHYEIAGVAVELVGGFVVSANEGRYEVKVPDGLLKDAEWLKLGGTEAAPVRVPLVPLAHELWFNRLRGRADRFELVAAVMAEQPDRHEPALRRLEAANRLT
ncbi:hypothetical protein BG52_10665, partial [Paenibacillus darwinianus]